VDLPAFRAAARALGVDLGDAQASALLALRALLEAGNARAALTTVTDEAGFLEVHALDSLALVRALEGEPAPATLIDVGSGAGFPALPAAIAWPALRVTALESTRKKCDFLREAARALGLEGRFAVIERRAEEAGRDPALRDAFDVVTARAVAALPVLAELCLPFARPGGLFVAWKTGKALETELPAAARAIAELRGAPARVLDAGLAGRDARLVVVRKEGPTPERYPRRVGIPEKRPLA
jgi:16S rRNA (guanine527-N7)-methyltransferase